LTRVADAGAAQVTQIVAKLVDLSSATLEDFATLPNLIAARAAAGPKDQRTSDQKRKHARLTKVARQNTASVRAESPTSKDT
jgi:hypothetical protein